MPRRDVPWYRWGFDLGATLLGLYFAFLGWTLVKGAEGNVGSGVLFLSLSALIGFFEWRNRKRFKFRIRDDEPGL